MSEMRKNRFLSLLLAAVMTATAALSLISCKSDENNENSEKPAPSKYDVTGTWMAEVEAPGTVGGGGQMTYDHQVTACTFNSDGSGTWYRFMLTNDSGNPIAVDGGAGHGDFTYSVSEDGKIACRLTDVQAPAYYPASLALTLSNDSIAGREGDVAYKMSRASDIMARWITEWDRRLHGGGNSDETTGDTLDLSMLTADVEARNGQTLTGTLGCNVKVSIADGATVTLRDATINGRSKNALRWAGITCPGNATIVLEGENSVRGFQRMFPGIHIAPGKTLTVSGSGSLSASSNGYGAGIGGGSSMDCGHIVIEGGTITSEGGNEAAGIGGGGYAACGNITITDDVTSLTATKGDGAKHSVGAGADGSCGTVTIFDKVGAISDDSFIFPVAVTGVSLSQTEATLAVGETLTLTATMIPEYAANFGASNVTWSSSDEAVATVNESGVVTAKGEGKATITVTTADGKNTATCTVTVYIPVTGVTLSQTSASLQFGETLTLTATVAPDNAANKSVTWSSNNEDVATVDENGVVTAKTTAGTATITATTADGGKTATCTVTVGVLETGVTLSQTFAKLLFGETLTLTATIAPANATNKSVTWSSSHPAVATVNENGVVTAKSAGTAIITVTTAIEKKTATCKVTVYDDESSKFLVDLSMVTDDVVAINGDILTGTLGKKVKISIASGATVTLRDATINGKDYLAYWAGITCLGDATIVIEGENSVMGFFYAYPGIYIPKGKTLTIRGDGSLTASGKNHNSASCGAGIGGGYFMECGNIVIEGGTINATGGRQSAGIGGGAFSGCGNITITSGVTSVTATKGDRCPYSIGGGERGWCGTVTIGGKETGPIGQSPYTYKP